MIADHLFPLLESETDSGRLVELAQILVAGDVPPEIMRAIALGRLTALRKDGGGVRGIVVGDMLRRVVARTMAQQVSKEVEEATSPFQYALTTRAGCECVAHVLQTLTDLDEHATIVSIDGVGAFDLISRQSMLDGLSAMENGEKLLPFVRSFYGAPSTYLWEDEMGTTHEVRQGEGGEQGDPLMPLLFSLEQHRALVAVQARLREGERLFALLDDVYVIVPQTEPGMSTRFCRRNCGGTRRFKSSTGRRRCGIGAAQHLQEWKNSQYQRGCWTPTELCEGTMHSPQVPKGSKFWVFPSAIRIMWRSFWPGRRENMNFF